jgi:hypothetical protein
MSEFIPKSGRVDYTNIRYAPVVNCVVHREGKILMIQRGVKMDLHPHHWNGISGFLDDEKTIEEKVLEELQEEGGIPSDHVVHIRRGPIFTQEDEENKKTWIVHAVLVEVTAENVTRDRESQDYVWLAIDEVRKLKTLPDFKKVFNAFFPEKKIVKHFKGGFYRIVGEALHTNDEREHVVYESLRNGEWWVRPKEEFYGHVETPEGQQSRFTPIPKE